MIKTIFAITLSILIFAGCGRVGKDERNAMNKEISKKIAEQNAAIETPEEPVKTPETNTEPVKTPETNTENKKEETSEFVSEENVKKMIFMLIEGSSDKDIRKLKKEMDDGRWKYDVEVIYNGMEYEFEIDAKTGEILNFESESIYD